MNEKTKGVIAYLFGVIGGFIVLLGYKDSAKETKLHAAQAIIGCLAYIIINAAISVITSILPDPLDFITSILSLVTSIGYLLFISVGIIKANNEQEFVVPVITDYAKKIFAKQIEG